MSGVGVLLCCAGLRQLRSYIFKLLQLLAVDMAASSTKAVHGVGDCLVHTPHSCAAACAVCALLHYTWSCCCAACGFRKFAVVLLCRRRSFLTAACFLACPRVPGLCGSGLFQQRECIRLHTSRLASTSGKQIPLENDAIESCLGGSQLIHALALSVPVLDPRAAAAVAHPD